MITSDKLTCREVVELVTDYLEASLLLEKQAQFEEHIADCPGCTAYIAQVQQTIGMLHKLSDEPLFPETKEELLRVFQEWKRE
jgi:predicted anti-sigma-YlaC factor YlaD